jgi:hypothetical protein
MNAGASRGQPVYDQAADGAGASGNQNVHGYLLREWMGNDIVVFHESPR